MNKTAWTRYKAELSREQEKKVKSIDFELVIENADKGAVQVTDIQLQEGKQVTATIPNTSDWFEKKLGTLDETSTAVGNDLYLGDQPRLFSNIQNRFYNIVGRGHEVIVIPNIYETNFNDKTVTTIVDLTLRSKGAFDLLRISTNYGKTVDETVYEDDSENPLNKRYSREFVFGGGPANSEIKLLGSKQIATLNGKRANMSARTTKVGNGDFKIKRQSFMGLAHGSNRIRIEFYKLVKGKMQDTGIGYWGIAEIAHWVEGGSKF